MQEQTGRLVCRDVGKVYSTGTVALSKVNIDIPTKGIFALIGRNGAGKTTLVRILATELMSSSGTALINGADVIKDPKKVREFIAVVPQESRLLMWTTPRQMIVAYLLYRGFSYANAKKRAAEVLKTVNIGKYADVQSQHLSGGTKRKALIATVLASEASMLFLDEPTTGLDPISRAELWNLLNKLKKDHFIFLTTHYLEEAERLADQIGIIENGKLLNIGTLDELRAHVKYDFSLTIFDNKARIKPRAGRIVTGLDGNRQILTTQKEANRIAKELIRKGTRFSTSPVSLEQIFYFIVKRSINEETEEKDEW